ncbi:Alpha-soluble NSF attachment protein [Hondaea fermentalgiana]|uniref:Alpha-soluble NSF attachment protein n=1 Tax=Hondaea fermentalgiana TaxID=2315210 RepID=A0A2R5GFJ9_9STRA|nr:Alpha-soluble NSF attachment protein [Hondaea fermentalgiana]|eukprot:GBG27021.1 Alpha-soluble NSF attachment protein [Hondaea fermentalgiana]
MEAPEVKRAKELVAKAESTLNSWSWFGSSSGKYDDACDLYSKAANNYKIAKQWGDAATCFLKSAEIKVKQDSQFEAASNYVLAAEMLAKVDQGRAIPLYRDAIAIYCELGRFGTAAKHAEAVGEIYERDNNLKEAIAYYQQASDCYSSENSTARAGKCLEKVALHSAMLNDYPKAIQGFEKLGTAALESNLLKFNAKKHFLHAGFCALARNDTVAAQNAIQRYSELDYTFRDSAECKLLIALTEACVDMDADKFADELFKYDSIRKLDPWETSILLRVKNTLTEAASGEADLL